MISNFTSEARRIYNLLQDEESKDILIKQMMFHITKDYKYIFDMVEGNVKDYHRAFSWNKYLKLANEKTKKNKLFIYGAGGEGRALKSILEIHNIQVEGFVDRNYKRFSNEGVKGPEEFINNYKNGGVCVSIGSEMYFKEIYDYLLSCGVRDEDILGSAALTKQQYFDKSLISYNDNEVFVDCGALDLQTCENFVGNCNKKIKTIYAFEPDEENIKICKEKRIAKNLEVEILPYGVWSSDGELFFKAVGAGTSRIDVEGNEKIEVRRIDSLLIDQPISFIKMDIEGAEQEALKGAEQVIKKYKPKLAISVYHKPEDFLTIPKIIHDYVPEYKLYLRHYSIYSVETVLYAVL
ncbi:FkbM family methyltransferase [Clostridium sp. KNHs205]|jgi:FkbM family methyltransferase|uniref:FkbM family methyltransferase n=1 Tax=Clostridium sp. KNHs205 TaxID=1449050 RepID=UPI00068DD193|nr:FkbM family methyltransferase [Clostridium sp. KNHs205]